jgi:hypothetical protein
MLRDRVWSTALEQAFTRGYVVPTELPFDKSQRVHALHVLRAMAAEGWLKEREASVGRWEAGPAVERHLLSPSDSRFSAPDVPGEGEGESDVETDEELKELNWQEWMGRQGIDSPENKSPSEVFREERDQRPLPTRVCDDCGRTIQSGEPRIHSPWRVYGVAYDEDKAIGGNAIYCLDCRPVGMK